MTDRLVALDVPGGPGFVTALERVWEKGDAAFVIDRRHPPEMRERVLDAMAPTAIVGANGEEHHRDGGVLVEPGDALVVATSGSSGDPKGVVLTHDAVEASARITCGRLGLRPDDHWLACLPLSHIGGLSVVTRALHLRSILTVLPGFDPDDVMASDANMVSLVATALRRIDAGKFRTVVLGGATPPAELPPNVVTTYGMTETGSGVVYDGVPLDDVAIDIDESGEIRVKSPTLLRAYRDGTTPVVDGWFATGDLGSWDPSGRLVVHGRKGDLIITGGENVWPDAVESALRSHPAVADVAVVGVPDAEWGHVVTAVVVPRGEPPTLAALRVHAKTTLPGFAAPRRLELVSALPRTSLGKIRRRELVAYIAPTRTPAPPSMT